MSATLVSRKALLRAVAVIVSLLAALGPVGCSPGYVMRAAYEEMKFLWRQQSIDALLRDRALDPDERGKLELLLRVRAFARGELGLRVDGSYRSISRVDGGAVVQLLTAARRERLEAYKWWFPIVGRVPYKGFFSREAALAAAGALEEEGYDTYVRPAIAFSTLGWFDDPLPSVLLERSRITLANVVFHELFHNTLFVRSQVTFNESAANFVGHRATIEFFCSIPPLVPEECQAAKDEWEDALQMSRFLTAAIAELEDFYDAEPKGKALREGRKRIFRSIRERVHELDLRGARYAGFSSAPINNATILHDRIYLRDLDVFEELHRREGSLRASIAALREVVEETDEPFSGLRKAVARPSLDVATR